MSLFRFSNSLFTITLALVGLAWLPSQGVAPAAEAEIERTIDVAPVWSGHGVGFCLLTTGDRQYVAYYDAQRRMTVASRRLGEDAWTRQLLPSQVGWDSHNYITMAVDSEGRLHLGGNMHCAPLVYFRTEKPYDIATLRKIDHMVGAREDSCTYPVFLKDAEGRLVFLYRDGGSGNGRRFFNVYDAKSQTWKRLIDTPLLEGEGKRNAYPTGIRKGPDGRYHMVWVWRDTPDANTNSHISYVRTSDLKHWETASGAPVNLPITYETKGVVVDPVPPGQGLINAGPTFGFDSEQRPIVSYHKYDQYNENGKSQIFNARWEKDHWQVYQTSDWDYRWDFGGGGSIGVEVHSGRVTVQPNGELTQTYSNSKYGSGEWVLDPETLKPIERRARTPFIPREARKVRSDFPGMGVRCRRDVNADEHDPVQYWLRWETLGPHRDQPREKPWPEPSMLQVYKLRRKSDEE